MKIAELRPDMAEKIVLTCSGSHLGMITNSTSEKEISPVGETKKSEAAIMMDTAIRTRDIKGIEAIFNVC
jgi:hypothetical protein